MKRPLPTFFKTFSSTIIDETGKTVTVADATQISATKKKFGSASCYFDGTGNQYLTLAAHSDFTFGNNRFTVDGQFYNDWSNSAARFIFGAPVDHRWAILYDYSSGKFVLYLSSDGISWGLGGQSSVQTFSLDTWHHIEFSWDLSVYRLFFDGSLIWSNTTSTPLYSGVNMGFQVGAFPLVCPPWKGYIDEIRVSKGITRHTSPFTPPSSAYSVDSYTKLLMHFDFH